MDPATIPAYGQQCPCCGHAIEPADVVEQVNIGGSGPTRLRAAHWGCAFGMARGHCYSGGPDSCTDQPVRRVG